MHFLIILSDFYKDISASLLKGAITELEKENCSYHKITVPGSLEIPSVVSYAVDLEAYDGFIALGCIIKGETIHHEVVAYESARALNDLAINMNLAIGNGIITADNKKQAVARADIKNKNKGGSAATAAIKLAKIRDKFQEVIVS
jgi:6,7-dimethyl-8-ribityllumazine synthase